MSRGRVPHGRVWRWALREELGRDQQLGRRQLARLWADVGRRHDVLAAAEAPDRPGAARRHLRLILPSIAVQQALLDRGVPTERGVAVVRKAARRLATGQRRRLRLLRYVPGAFWLFRHVAPHVLRTGFTTAGFEVRWRERSATTVAFDVTRCLYLGLFRRYGVGELTGVYCDIDDYWYDQLAPVIGWRRTTTLARGGRHCDFRYEDPRQGRTRRRPGSTAARAPGATGGPEAAGT